MSQPPKKPPFSSVPTKESLPVTSDNGTPAVAMTIEASPTSNQTNASSQDGQQTKETNLTDHNSQFGFHSSGCKQQTIDVDSPGDNCSKMPNLPPKSSNQGVNEDLQESQQSKASEVTSLDDQTGVSRKSSSILPQPSQATTLSKGGPILVNGLRQASNQSTLPVGLASGQGGGARLPQPAPAPSQVNGSFQLQEDPMKLYWLHRVMPRIVDYLEANPDVDQALGLVIDRACHSLLAQSPPPSDIPFQDNASRGAHSDSQQFWPFPMNQPGNICAAGGRASPSGPTNSQPNMAKLNRESSWAKQQQGRPLPMAVKENLPLKVKQMSQSESKQVNPGSSTKSS